MLNYVIGNIVGEICWEYIWKPGYELKPVVTTLGYTGTREHKLVLSSGNDPIWAALMVSFVVRPIGIGTGVVQEVTDWWGLTWKATGPTGGRDSFEHEQFEKRWFIHDSKWFNRRTRDGSLQSNPWLSEM